MDERFQHGHYLIRRKVLKLLGGAFHIYGPDERLLFYANMKAFKLREDIRLYDDESMRTEVLTIHARGIIDFAATYDVTDAATGERVGALRRHGGRSFFRDEWGILDDHDRQIGSIVEDSMVLALLRRFVTSLLPQTFQADIEGHPVATYSQQFNPFVFKLNVDFSGDTGGLLDPRIGIAAGILLCAIEGRQESS
jgi:uncharacterized protein YxjI